MAAIVGLVFLFILKCYGLGNFKVNYRARGAEFVTKLRISGGSNGEQLIPIINCEGSIRDV